MAGAGQWSGAAYVFEQEEATARPFEEADLAIVLGRLFVVELSDSCGLARGNRRHGLPSLGAAYDSRIVDR